MFNLKKVVLLLFIFTAFFVALSEPSEAKLLPQAKKLSGAKIPAGKSSTVGISAKLRKDRKAITVYFSGLQNAASVAYSLSYETNGKAEGIAGTIKPQGKSYDSRELTFGTCSGRVCTYHANIQNAVLQVTSALSSGKTLNRKFRVRI